MFTNSFSVLFYLKRRSNYVSGDLPIYLRITASGHRTELATIDLLTVNFECFLSFIIHFTSGFKICKCLLMKATFRYQEILDILPVLEHQLWAAAVAVKSFL
jgi:hypothetical protein